MLEVNKKFIESAAEKGMRAIVGETALLLAGQDPHLILMYADIGCRIGANKLFQSHPEKCVQCGIAEQNMVGVAAAMANEGFHVFATTYAPFITARVLDQIRVNMGIMKSPVTLIGVSAGSFMSDLGPALTAFEDIAHIRPIPNIAIVSPADCLEAVKAIIALSKYDKPAYLRLTSGFPNQTVYKNDYTFEIGKAITLKEGRQTVIFAAGTIICQCLEAAEILEQKGISCAVVNMHTIKPLDTDIIDRFLDCNTIFTVEEHSIIGGLGGAIAEYITEKSLRPILKRIGTPDYFFNADSFAVSLERANLTAQGIAKQILSALN